MDKTTLCIPAQLRYTSGKSSENVITSSENIPEPVSQKDTYIDIMNDSNDSYKKRARRETGQLWKCNNLENMDIVDQYLTDNITWEELSDHN